MFSFTNPLASSTTNPKIADKYKENPTISRNRFTLLRNRKVKWFLIVLLAILLITVTIVLTVYFVNRQKKADSSVTSTTSVPMSSSTIVITTTTTISSSTGTSTITTISTTTLMTSGSSTSRFSSTPQPPCASAEWDFNGITVASKLYDPFDIAIDSENNVIVGDTENHRLQKYFNNGTNITLFTGTKALSVFIDRFDTIYVADQFLDEVKVLNSNGELITTIDGSNITGSFYNSFTLSTQSGLYVDKNNSLYISDVGHHRVVKYYLELGYGIVIAGEHGAGSALNQLNGPYGLYVDEIKEIGAVYICDHQNHRIQKWISGAKEGITVAFNDEKLRAPISILLQPTADQMIMFISSFDSEQVFKWIPYSSEAESVVAGISEHMGTESDRLSSPRGIKFDQYWNLYVADTGNNRVQKFLFNTSSCEYIA
ncbi:hypothetical protein I4U23_019953 [Adineta vaga]|nr:hypothetical protein I4U23_019953 [Adineta vaga]